jgi:hypothetical protein
MIQDSLSSQVEEYDQPDVSAMSSPVFTRHSSRSVVESEEIESVSSTPMRAAVVELSELVDGDEQINHCELVDTYTIEFD